MAWLQLLAHSPPNTCTQNAVPSPRKTVRNGVNKKAWPDKPSDHQPVYLQPALTLFSHISASPKLPWSFSFPVFGSSHKPPGINLVQSHKTLSLHPVMCLIPPGSVPHSPKGALESSWWWCWVLPLAHGAEGISETALRETMSLSLTRLWGSSASSCPWAPLCLWRQAFYHISWQSISVRLGSPDRAVLWLRHEGTLFITPRNPGQAFT